jgi:hypothetical protein
MVKLFGRTVKKAVKKVVENRFEINFTAVVFGIAGALQNVLDNAY